MIIECVPNISEGCDKKKIEKIVSVVARDGVKLLDVSSDENHNRSVITFAGDPEAVKEAAFDLIKKSVELIDMSKHKGEHPRVGAVDVCPFVPIRNAGMDDCVRLARELGEAVGKLGVSGYFYGYAAKRPERKILADIRAGEYEGLSEKLKQEAWKPDFGPLEFNPKFGVVVIGARDFLIAYNVNLKNDNLELAGGIARIIRGSGGLMEIDGKKIRIAGVFPSVQAVKIDTRNEGYAQISMNLNDYKIVPIHVVFENIKRMAELCGAEIHSSEIVGLVPADSLSGVALKYLRLKNFNYKKQVIEEAIK